MSDPISEAASSDLLFTLGVVGAMKHFNLAHWQVQEAIDKAYLTRGPKAIARLRGEVRNARLRKRVVSHEVTHPMIHRRLTVEGLSLRVVGREYEVTHTWCANVLEDFTKLAEVLKVDPSGLLPDIEQEARDLGGIDYRRRAKARA